MIIYNYDYNGVYTGVDQADESPLEPGVFLLPANATLIPPLAPLADHALVFKNGAWGYVRIGSDNQPSTVAQPPTDDEINAERDRRIALGSAFNIAAKVITVQGRPQDQVNLLALYSKAQEAKALGVTSPVFKFRDFYNVMFSLTPNEMIQLVISGLAWVEHIYEASWKLKDETRPLDYKNDRYWA